MIGNLNALRQRLAAMPGRTRMAERQEIYRRPADEEARRVPSELTPPVATRVQDGRYAYDVCADPAAAAAFITHALAKAESKAETPEPTSDLAKFIVAANNKRLGVNQP